MTRLPGVPLSEIIRDPEYYSAPGCLEDMAAGIGELLGRSCVSKTTKAMDGGKDEAEVEGEVGDGIARLTFAKIEEQLTMAVGSTDPKIIPYREVYQGLLEEVRTFSRSSDEAQVWMEVSNDDVSPTNIIVQTDTTLPDSDGVVTSRQGVKVSGLVDWQDVLLQPLGYSTKALFWLIGWGIGDKYALHPNAREIERSFWRGYVGGLRGEKKGVLLEACLRVDPWLGARLYNDWRCSSKKQSRNTCARLLGLCWDYSNDGVGAWYVERPPESWNVDDVDALWHGEDG